VAVNAIKRSVEDIVAHGRAIRPWVGVAMASVNQDIARQLNVPVQEGVVVTTVSPGSPAATAGLHEGDVITAIGGAKVTDADAARHAIMRAHVGDSVPITLYRERQKLEPQVKIGERPPPAEMQPQ